MMDRRGFLKNATLVSAACLMDFREALAWGAKDAEVGKAWKGWKKGQFQIHLIYTGVSESMFLIFPDGTTMLLDCGDHIADLQVGVVSYYTRQHIRTGTCTLRPENTSHTQS